VRPEVGLGEPVARARLFDPLDRDLQVLVLDERDSDQLLELRVVEELPPGVFARLAASATGISRQLGGVGNWGRS
jgi:hypothetical protein